MILQFRHIELTNFRSYVGTHKFVFDAGTGLHFLKGKNKMDPALEANDAGKSTIFDAFAWVQAGKTTQGLRNPDILPWFGTKETTLVRLFFTIDGNKHRIARSANPNSLRLDGKDVDQGAIDATLQLPFEILTQTVLMGQGKPLFFDLSPSDAMGLFSEVLNLSRWEVRASRASNQAKKLTAEKTEVEFSLKHTKETLHTAESDYKQLKKTADAWVTEQSNKHENIARDLKKTKKELARVTAIKEEADITYDAAATEAKALRTEIEKASIAMLELSKAADITTIKVIENDQARIRREIKEISTVGAFCSVCKQEVSGNHIKKHKEKLENAIHVLEDKRTGEQVKLDKAQDKFNVFQASLAKQISKLREFESISDKAESTARIATTDVANIQASIHRMQAQLNENQETENPYQVQLSKLRKRKSELLASVEEIGDKQAAIEKQIAPNEFWAKGFKDIRLHIIDEVLEELELATNAMLPEVGLDGWEVKYDIEKETKKGTTQSGLNVSIFSPKNKAPVKWKSWGGGVGQRLRIVSALALSEVLLNYSGITTNLEILDEPTASLSVPGVNDLCEFLANRAESLGKAIWMVDHRSIESSLFASVTTVIKDKSGSSISS